MGLSVPYKRVKEEDKLIRFETDAGCQMQVDWVEFPKDNLSAFVARLDLVEHLMLKMKKQKH